MHELFRCKISCICCEKKIRMEQHRHNFNEGELNAVPWFCIEKWIYQISCTWKVKKYVHTQILIVKILSKIICAIVVVVTVLLLMMVCWWTWLWWLLMDMSRWPCLRYSSGHTCIDIHLCGVQCESFQSPLARLRRPHSGVKMQPSVNRCDSKFKDNKTVAFSQVEAVEGTKEYAGQHVEMSYMKIYFYF